MDKTYNLFGATKPTTKRFADLAGPDFYPTPRWATLALLDNERFNGDIWECACGDGAMSSAIAEEYRSVYSSDLYERGFGEANVDFLHASKYYDNIITNPPFHSAEAFVENSLKRAGKKFALLLRLAFLEGGNRQRTIFSCAAPSRVWVFSERITFYPKGAVRSGSGTTAYAWFVWDKDHNGPSELKWLPSGYKKRYK